MNLPKACAICLVAATCWTSGSESPAAGEGRFRVQRREDRLIISRGGQPAAEFVFADKKILRPYFANLHAAGGTQVTRTHPPVPGRDDADHDTMHPGVWLGLGDVSGSDFWRNKGAVEHLRFLVEPRGEQDRVRFATLSRLAAPGGAEVCRLTSRFELAERPAGRLLIWDATFQSDDSDFTFGDQEEMGFGARVATELTEKNGGQIVNSHGQRTAAKTWGRQAAWCDYSGVVSGRRAGVTLMAKPSNFRPSWWHNRDYGVFVANPFGRAAMKQGPPSVVTVRRGEPFRIVFAALLHDAADYRPAEAYEDFLRR